MTRGCVWCPLTRGVVIGTNDSPTFCLRTGELVEVVASGK